jgi:hypothetical protein
VIREQPVKKEVHDFGLAHPFHIFSPAGDHIFFSANCGEAVGYTGLAEKALKQRIFEILADLQASFHQLPDVNIMAAGHIPFISGYFKYGAVGLAKTATVALGDFIIDGFQLLIHSLPQDL